MPTSDWLGTLYERFREELFLTAWSTLRQREMAEDAVHAAVVRLAALDVPPRDPKLYLFRAVRNAAVDSLRSRSRRGEAPLPFESEVPGRAESGADRFGDEAQAAVASAIASLDDRSRETVELHLHAGLTFREIAELLGEPLPTVASRYRRALERLGEKLKSELAEPGLARASKDAS